MDSSDSVSGEATPRGCNLPKQISADSNTAVKRYKTPVHSLQSKRNDLQLYTSNYELWTVKCNDFWFYWEDSIQICSYAELISQKNAFRLPSPHIPFLTQESLFCHQREPLFFKSGKSDIFCSKKFAMSLIRAIFAFGNGTREWPIPFSSSQSAFALPSLWLRSGFALGGEEKHKEMRQQRHGTNERSLTYLLIGFSQGGWNLYVSSREIGKSWRK